jgi:hypothetical protein
MPTWLLLLYACWVASVMALGFKTWFLQFEMFDHLAPGATGWRMRWFKGIGIPATEQLIEAGRVIKRRYYRLVCITMAYFVVGGLSLQHLSKVFAR